MHHGTCVTHVPWCMSGSLTCGGGENVPVIPGACATRNFTYLARGPWGVYTGQRGRMCSNAYNFSDRATVRWANCLWPKTCWKYTSIKRCYHRQKENPPMIKESNGLPTPQLLSIIVYLMVVMSYICSVSWFVSTISLSLQKSQHTGCCWSETYLVPAHLQP